MSAEMTFRKAEKSKSKLRLALFGPAGSGKTYTALAIAHGLIAKLPQAKIGVADSERGSASKYAGREDKASGIKFAFDSAEFEESKKIEDYLHLIHQAAEEKYDVLIIDSMTHAWEELLEEIEKIAQTRFKGNSWAAWQEGTPKQRKLIDAILSFPGHIIATMRSKTEWQAEKDIEGKTRPKRVGLKPEQGKNIEYEFDMLIDMSEQHYGTILKDRTGKFQDAIIDKPGVEFGKQLATWLEDGVVPEPQTIKPQPATPVVLMPAAKATEEQVKELNREAKRLNISPEDVKKRLKPFDVTNFKDLKRSDADDILEYLKAQEVEKPSKKK